MRKVNLKKRESSKAVSKLSPSKKSKLIKPKLEIIQEEENDDDDD